MSQEAPDQNPICHNFLKYLSYIVNFFLFVGLYPKGTKAKLPRAF